MLTIRELQDEIMKLKKEKDVCIIAHSYQSQDVIEIADYVGDSYGLSKEAQKAPQKNILMCGVRFMAETAKILSPEKRVFLSHRDAGCPMAEQLSKEELRELKKYYKDSAVVAYINTTAELKTECDVCVTSSSALDIVRKLPQKEILFIPDCNLGAWVEKNVPEKTFHFIRGGCPTHIVISKEEVMEKRALHPGAKVLVHPECRKEVSDIADYVGSTTGIMDYAEKSDAKEFIIGTENSIKEHLQYALPHKKFYVLSKNCVCRNMKLTNLYEVYSFLKGEAGEEIILDEDVMKKAKHSIDEMLKY